MKVMLSDAVGKANARHYANLSPIGQEVTAMLHCFDFYWTAEKSN